MRLITTKELRTLHIAPRHHHLINSRLAILRYADEYGFKGAARRFGLDRKTVRTWHRRWVASGPAGLVPRHPRTRRRRISEEAVRLIEQARRDLHCGAMRTWFWLDRVHRIRVAAATIRRICRDLGYPPIRRTGPRRPRQPILFSKAHPGECVQIDVKEVNIAGQKCFQYTALDDCTRYRVLRLYPRKYHGTSLDFLATVRHTLSFPIRKVQVDNGTEFPWPLLWPCKRPVPVCGTSNRAGPNRTAKWNGVIASTRKNFGVAPRSTASRPQSRRCVPGSIATTTTGSRWRCKASRLRRNWRRFCRHGTHHHRTRHAHIRGPLLDKSLHLWTSDPRRESTSRR